jgi:DNA-binding response OmpR family regulator
MKCDREKALEAGASDYVTKPVDPEKLLAVIHSWRRKRRGAEARQVLRAGRDNTNGSGGEVG